MRTKLAAVPVIVVTGLGTLVATTSSEARPAGVDLAMTGSVVAGVTGAQSGQELAFAFTLRNRGTVPIDTSFTFTVENGTVSDYICPLVSSGFNIDPDSPACETGWLDAHKTTQAAILVQTPSAAGVMTVRACASDLNGSTDPVPDNDCATLRVPIS
jgi:hypothetical protein